MHMKMMMSRRALEEYGLVNLGSINWNLSPPVLVEHALARNEAILASNGVLAATTGTHTGRSPKDKFIVSNEEYAAKIWWGENNYPISRENFDAVRSSLQPIYRDVMSMCWMLQPLLIPRIVCLFK